MLLISIPFSLRLVGICRDRAHSLANAHFVSRQNNTLTRFWFISGSSYVELSQQKDGCPSSRVHQIQANFFDGRPVWSSDVLKNEGPCLYRNHQDTRSVWRTRQSRRRHLPFCCQHVGQSCLAGVRSTVLRPKLRAQPSNLCMAAICTSLEVRLHVISASQMAHHGP